GGGRRRTGAARGADRPDGEAAARVRGAGAGAGARLPVRAATRPHRPRPALAAAALTRSPSTAISVQRAGQFAGQLAGELTSEHLWIVRHERGVGAGGRDGLQVTADHPPDRLADQLIAGVDRPWPRLFHRLLHDRQVRVPLLADQVVVDQPLGRHEAAVHEQLLLAAGAGQELHQVLRGARLVTPPGDREALPAEDAGGGDRKDPDVLRAYPDRVTIDHLRLAGPFLSLRLA